MMGRSTSGGPAARSQVQPSATVIWRRRSSIQEYYGTSRYGIPYTSYANAQGRPAHRYGELVRARAAPRHRAVRAAARPVDAALRRARRGRRDRPGADPRPGPPRAGLAGSLRRPRLHAAAPRALAGPQRRARGGPDGGRASRGPRVPLVRLLRLERRLVVGVGAARRLPEGRRGIARGLRARGPGRLDSLAAPALRPLRLQRPTPPP